MKLIISQLKEGDNPFHFESQTDAWLRDVLQRVEKRGYRVGQGLTVDANLMKCEPDYYLRGTLKMELQQPCSRCAESFSLPIKHPFDVALAHITNTGMKPAALAEESEELDINFFEGNDIDLSPIIEEQFFLSVPYQTLCRPDCKGICQHCGVNLNTAKCSCQSINPVSPFSVLQGIKL